MIYIFLLAFFSLIPVLAYLLSLNTQNKGYILGISILIIFACLFSFTGKFSFLGSLNKQVLKDKIFLDIKDDSIISQETFLKFEKLVADDDRIYWMQSLILEAIDSKKYNSAESLITYSERYFKSSEEKFIFYSLYKDLRDSKFPLFANSEIVIVLDKPCSSFNGLIEVFIMNGPAIPIARANFSNKEEVSLNNTSSSIPGFDIASAYLNKETVDVKVELKCGESGLEYITEALILLDQTTPSNTYKISPNEWLKK